MQFRARGKTGAVLGLRRGKPLTRGAGIGGAQEGFEEGEAEGAETVAQGDGAGEPRGTAQAFAQVHEAEIERDDWRHDPAE